ncbi:MAG: helicase HerA domain-containing protein [Gammaproteobacteria bacterium]
MSEELDKSITDAIGASLAKGAGDFFRRFLQEKQCVGDVFSITYDTARVQIHDYERQQVGGIPALSFLLASRILPVGDATVDPAKEDSSAILLRVMDAAELPDSKMAEGVRAETARRVSGEIDKHWDDNSAMDTETKNRLGYAGVHCRILGTFFLEEDDDEPGKVVPCFGSDISNYYPNRGLKVYKPTGDALEQIVNYVRPADLKDLKEKASPAKVPLGFVRYASTHRKGQMVDNVPVNIYPADLLTQKTAVFGMTRMGKSNTMKIIAQSVYNLRRNDGGHRIGQIIFDTNGEYANENVQDAGALKNLWKVAGLDWEKEVATYGIAEHDKDPTRRLMRVNFYRKDDLQIGKEIIDGIIADDSTRYLANFRGVRFEPPATGDRSAECRYNRRLLCYRALLHKAGFKHPDDMRPDTSELFNKELLNAMRQSPDEDKRGEYGRAADILSKPSPSWARIAEAVEILRDFVNVKKSGYSEFNSDYTSRKDGSGDSWADDGLKKILEMFFYPNGSRIVGRADVYHSKTANSDYADDVYADLQNGKLVIIDQSTGEPEHNKGSADRVMWRIFRRNQEKFRKGKVPPDIIVYVEEAHNQLPSEKDADLRDVWVRTAKEGAKFHIGMVYATQEVSTIQRNILKNTANWFIGHLNNTDETKELRKYYDFADFVPSILRAQDKGFLRVKTLSNPFVVPVQVRKFSAEEK